MSKCTTYTQPINKFISLSINLITSAYANYITIQVVRRVLCRIKINFKFMIHNFGLISKKFLISYFKYTSCLFFWHNLPKRSFRVDVRGLKMQRNLYDFRSLYEISFTLKYFLLPLLFSELLRDIGRAKKFT